MNDGDPNALNRAHWDSLAALHGRGEDGYYDLDGLLAGRSSLSTPERAAVEAAVGDPRGRDVVHLQCHIGFDSISLARAGANVTGVDLSPASLARAGKLAERCGVQLELVEADTTALPNSLHDRFDLAYATFGVIAWIGDLGAWMRQAAACLRPGGRLVLVDLHPLLCMLESTDPFEASGSYGHQGPIHFVQEGSYATEEGVMTASENVQYAHGLGEVVSAAAAAGLRIDELIEHAELDHDALGRLLEQDEDGRWRCRLTGYPLPVLFTLRATRPG